MLSWRKYFHIKCSTVKMTWCLQLGPSCISEPLPAPGRDMSFSLRAAMIEGHLGVQRLDTDILAAGFFPCYSNKSFLGSIVLVLLQGQTHILQAAPARWWWGTGLTDHLISSVVGRRGLHCCSAWRVAPFFGSSVLVTGDFGGMQNPCNRVCPTGSVVIPAHLAERMGLLSQ